MKYTDPSIFIATGPYEREYISQKKYQASAAWSLHADIENIDSDLCRLLSTAFMSSSGQKSQYL